MVPLKYLSNFRRTLKIPLINCEVNLILTWSENCVIVYTNVANQGTKFAITETKLYVPVVTLSTQDNGKLLLQLNSGFKRIINWKKNLAKPDLWAQNSSLDDLVELSFQGVNRIFVFALDYDVQRTSNKLYLSNVETKDYNVMIEGKKFFDQPVKNNKITYENNTKTATCQRDDYATDCLLDYTLKIVTKCL